MKKVIFIILIFIASMLLVYFFYLRNRREKLLIKQGNELVTKIEAYKMKYKRLPNSLKDIGVEEKEDGLLYYSKTDSNEYTIWFGISLGESKTYYSDTKKWGNDRQ